MGALEGVEDSFGLAAAGAILGHDFCAINLSDNLKPWDLIEKRLRLAKEAGLERVFIHCFTDGRDTPPRSAKRYMAKFLKDAGDVPGLSVGVVSGRYYAMDRDKRWDRVSKAYKALVDGKGERMARDAVTAIQQSYDEDVSDEFVLPTVIDAAPGVRDGDTVIFVNFRADRARELTMAFVNEPFEGFERKRVGLARALVPVGKSRAP